MAYAQEVAEMLAETPAKPTEEEQVCDTGSVLAGWNDHLPLNGGSLAAC